MSEPENQAEPMMQSKKFVGYLLAEGTWKALAVLILVSCWDAMPTPKFIALLAVIVVAGFVEVGYLLGQASLDKYVRIAKIAAAAGKNMTFGGVSMSHPAEPQPKAKTPTKG